MLSKFRAAGLVWPTLLAIPALALLLGLGHWQMQRKAWKDQLVAEIKARTAGQPKSLDAVMGALTASHPPGEDGGVGEYTRVRVRGSFDHNRELFLYAPNPRLGPGFHVYTPLEIDRASCDRFVIVNRGFVPEGLRRPDQRVAGQVGVGGPVEVVGLLRFAEKPGNFTPANEPHKNLWFWRDWQAMTKAAASGANDCPLPFFLDAEAEPANPGGWPRGGTTNLDIPNRHLEYALTWYGLAATLIAVFVAFARGRLRARTPAI